MNAEIGNSTSLTSAGNINVEATDTATSLNLSAGQVSFGGTAGVGASAVTLVRTQGVDAGIGSFATVSAGGGSGVTVIASQVETPQLIAVGGSGGGTAGVAGSVSIDILNDTTSAHIGQGATVGCGGCANTPSTPQGVSVAATDTTNALDTAGALAIGGDAGIGAGVDVEVFTKNTTASIASSATVQTTGSVTDTATSTENVLSVSAGAAFGGDAAVAVNAGVSVLSITTTASIGSAAAVTAGDSVDVAATEGLTLKVIAGNISGSGAAAIGAAGAVPVVNKTTEAWIDSNAHVNAAGAGANGISVASGDFTVTPNDPRFTPAAALATVGDGKTIDLAADDPGFVDGFTEGEAVRYDNGGGADIQCTSCTGPTAQCPTCVAGELNGGDAASGLLGGTYYAHVVNDHEIQLMATPGGPILTGLSAPTSCPSGSLSSCYCGPPQSACGGESQRFVGAFDVTAASDDSPRFDPSTDVSGNDINLPYTMLVQRRPRCLRAATPSSTATGGGTPIGGLTDGQASTSPASTSAATPGFSSRTRTRPAAGRLSTSRSTRARRPAARTASSRRVRCRRPTPRPRTSRQSRHRRTAASTASR